MTPDAAHPSHPSDTERRVMSRVMLRTIPLLMLCYFIGYVDRVNVGFAALTMNNDLHFSPDIYATGAGIFFVGYFFLEVPSNLILERVGARRWIARIMITWGIIAAAMCLVQGETSFYVMRFVLGAAEAGFFPGVMLYLTFWFPAAYRARVVALFMLANPISSVIGAPISGWVLGMDGVYGLQGWKWLFIIEGLPAVVLGFVVLKVLVATPADAPWLSADDRAWLTTRIANEKRAAAKTGHLSLLKGLTHPRVLVLGAIYFGLAAANYGMSMWLPQIIKGFGATNLQTGFITALPYCFGAVAMVVWGRHSDRHGERLWHVIIPGVVAGSGLIMAGLTTSPVLMMASLCFAGLGIFGCLPAFWTLPPALLQGTAAAGGLALINSIGNLSGFFGPKIVGYVREATGSFSSGLFFLAALPLLAALLTFALRHHPAFQGRTAARTGLDEDLPAGPILEPSPRV